MQSIVQSAIPPKKQLYLNNGDTYLLHNYTVYIKNVPYHIVVSQCKFSDGKKTNQETKSVPS